MEGAQFDYYYGAEADQFTFYRIPKTLVKDGKFKYMSCETKLLYGLMLDRMSLSMKNGWLDEENRVYIIFTLEEIMDDLNCAHTKGCKIVAELEENGLIERRKQGQGKPTIIYVKNFVAVLEEAEIVSDGDSINTDRIENQEKTQENNGKMKTSQKQKSGLLKIGSQDLPKTEVKTSQKQKSGFPKNSSQDFLKSETNYTDINNIYNNQSINPDDEIENIVSPEKDGLMDNAMQISIAYEGLVRENIGYDWAMEHLPHEDKGLFEDIYRTICDIVSHPQDTVWIGKQVYPYSVVQARFLKLNFEHVQYVMESLKKTSTDIKNIRSYLLTALWNSISTMNYFYTQMVRHDLKN